MKNNWNSCDYNGSCRIENANPSFLNGADCFDINSVHKNEGAYYNYFEEFLNYDNSSIQIYACGCQKDFARKGNKQCSILSCKSSLIIRNKSHFNYFIKKDFFYLFGPGNMNNTNPCTNEMSCLPREALSNGLNILYCPCEPGKDCLKTTTDYCSI